MDSAPAAVFAAFSISMAAWRNRSAPPTAGLVLRAESSANTFGFWQSPWLEWMGALGNGAPVGDSLFTIQWVALSPGSSAGPPPEMRLRATRADWSQSAMLSVTNRDGGALSPPRNGRIYRQWAAFRGQPPRSLGLAFDLLSFDSPANPPSPLMLDKVVISRQISDPFSSNPRREKTFDFTLGAQGWTSRTPAPAGGFDAPRFAASSSGLAISAAAPPPVFGYWCSPENPPAAGRVVLEPGRLYRLRFTIDSDAAAADRAHVPQFRLRANSSGLEAASLVVVQSRGATADAVPVAGDPRTYAVYLEWPSDAPPRLLLAALDLFYDDPADAAATTLTLKSLVIDSVAPGPIAP